MTEVKAMKQSALSSYKFSDTEGEIMVPPSRFYSYYCAESALSILFLDTFQRKSEYLFPSFSIHISLSRAGYREGGGVNLHKG